jgi:hypothetical protein
MAARMVEQKAAPMVASMVGATVAWLAVWTVALKVA